MTTISKVLSAVLIYFLTIQFSGCGKKDNGSEEYISSIKSWHSKRIANLKKETGWLNLSGLFWLERGANSIGSGRENNIVFPEDMPETIGVITVNDSMVYFKSSEIPELLTDGKNIPESRLIDDLSGTATQMQWKSYRWNIIKRGDRYGIRFRNLNSPVLKEFKGIETYPIDSTWRIEADFIKFEKPKVISIPNIIGTIEEDTVEGELRFMIYNKEYSLIPVSEGDDLFIIFADETNGDETYGAGRFLYSKAPDSTGKVIVDFNKSYNPPCAFTKYATCPLPPKENYLRLKIEAGEKKYGGDH